MQIVQIKSINIIIWAEADIASPDTKKTSATPPVANDKKTVANDNKPVVGGDDKAASNDSKAKSGRKAGKAKSASGKGPAPEEIISGKSASKTI